MRRHHHLGRGLPIALLLALSACGGSASTTVSTDTSAATSAASVSSPSSATASSSVVPSSAFTSSAASSSATTVASAAATSSAAGAAAVSGAPVSFKADIQPIFAASCVACHGSGKAGGLSLQTYADLMAGGQDGAVIKPGDADGSLLVQKVKGTQTIGARMPRGGSPLPDDQIQKIANWVVQGAKDN